MKNNLTKLIPHSLKPVLRRIYYFPIDVIDQVKGRHDNIPPKSINFIGADHFEEVGEEFKNYFIELANLQPNNRVLDVGCGIGRMAIPLTNYLSDEGEYWGFDIVKKGIDWCQSNVSSKFSNFHFQHSDIYNKSYNRRGGIIAKDYQFPFDDEFFDFVFLTSVFTHMLPLDLENYLSEISRVLKPSGRCLITYFLLNKESEGFIRSGRSSLNFAYEIQGCKTTDKNNPESAIAYKEEFVLGLFKEYGLTIMPPVYYGYWCNRDTFLTYQDLIIAQKYASVEKFDAASVK